MTAALSDGGCAKQRRRREATTAAWVRATALRTAGRVQSAQRQRFICICCCFDSGRARMRHAGRWVKRSVPHDTRHTNARHSRRAGVWRNARRLISPSVGFGAPAAASAAGASGSSWRGESLLTREGRGLRARAVALWCDGAWCTSRGHYARTLSSLRVLSSPVVHSRQYLNGVQRVLCRAFCISFKLYMLYYTYVFTYICCIRRGTKGVVLPASTKLGFCD
jgi:hypothetical protein